MDKTKYANKVFIYVTPVISNTGISRLREHFEYLNDIGGIEVVAGDLGTLNLLQNYKRLRPRLGRPRVYIPARSPWSQITKMPNVSALDLQKVEKIFYQTSLNYRESLEFFKTYNVEGADVDWIPQCFPYFDKIIERGFKLAVHTSAIPVAVTGRCHTARFLDEKKPEFCTRPCLRRVFTISQRELAVSFALSGNVVFRLVQPQEEEIRMIHGTRVDELILHMDSISKLMTSDDVNKARAVFR